MNSHKILKEVGSFLLELIICFIVVELFVHFIARPIRVVGSSMYPTYEDGAIGFTYRYNLKKSNIERGDVVILYCEERDELIIKRVIGLPGDTVYMQDDVLMVNDEVVNEDYLDADYIAEWKADNLDDSGNPQNFTTDFYIELGDDEYWVLGDNRPVSADSRFFGTFSFSDIKGKDGWVIYPFDQFGRFD